MKTRTFLQEYQDCVLEFTKDQDHITAQNETLEKNNWIREYFELSSDLHGKNTLECCIDEELKGMTTCKKLLEYIFE